MQGLNDFIETGVKAAYINQLLAVGFDTVDFGSFVSPKAIPQMRDTAEVLAKLDLSQTATKLLAIVANQRGAEEACRFPEIQYLGYPFSISETFQLRNTNATIAESLERAKAIQDICEAHGKTLVLYISMGFGNPYGDPWNAEIVQKWVDNLAPYGIRIFSLSDTIGCSNPENIAYLFGALIPAYPSIEFGAHLHTQPNNWREKIQAAWENGCRRFDGAMRGFGGCPMAKDDLTGNMATENLIFFFDEVGADLPVNRTAFGKSMAMAMAVFPH
ncbi:MAG: hydroxymethylglutaryl-CoA lyase [Saprospirales bacterium]|nr:hydroxymethylglutaryl-CoA lyase [Saprospirales bacterium]MBK8920388.1 hydroxymethylglutaryl-CoA lyase [Saprospirales bacterium]